MASTVTSWSRQPAANVHIAISPDTVVSLLYGFQVQANKIFQRRTYSEPPPRNPTNPILPRDVERWTDNGQHLAKDPLDNLLKDTDVRLCFADVDHVIMDLEGCHTMIDLVERIKLYLDEEIGRDQISHVDVAQDCDQEFRVRGKTMRRLRLLPGPGRERTYDTFLCLLMSAPSQGESHSFKMFVHTKGNGGV